MKKILLVALTALALGLASIGEGAPAVAGGARGIGGEVHAGLGEPALAGGAYGGVLGDEAEPAIAGRKPAVSPGSGGV